MEHDLFSYSYVVNLSAVHHRCIRCLISLELNWEQLLLLLSIDTLETPNLLTTHRVGGVLKTFNG